MKKPYEHLYIHVPFCATKCAYCAFYSAIDEEALIPEFLNKMDEEFKKYGPSCLPLKSVFFGGGTPTLLDAPDLERLLLSVKSNFTIGPDTEITLECNPETMNDDKAQVIAKHATRISMGLQSFSQQNRKTIGRKGDCNDVFKAVDLLRKHNFTNIGLDLIYAIPGQSLEDWEIDLRAAVDIGTPHISAYSLSIDEGAALARGKTREAKDDISCDMWELAEKVLNEYGLERYEISNYAKPGHECIHNSGIWAGDAYIGCGPSAASFDGLDRWQQPSNLEKWLAEEKPTVDEIPPESRAREIFIMGLRTNKGWGKEEFSNQTGYDYTPWLAEIDQFLQYNFITLTDHSISLTTEGLAFWNTICEELV